MDDNIVVISQDEVDPETMCSYEEAAMILGVTHNRVRILTGSGIFHIVARVLVRPNVLKVYIDKDEVIGYNEAHKVRSTKRVRMTEEEWKKFRETFGDDRIKP